MADADIREQNNSDIDILADNVTEYESKDTFSLAMIPQMWLSNKDI